MQPSRPGPAEHFTGSVRVDFLFEPAGARAHGVAQKDLAEVITHLAFYTGWPSAVSAVGIAREVFHAEAQPGK
jgi:hypothetical protein